MPNSDQPEPVGVAPTPEDTWRTEVALFRYTLILPLLRHACPEPAKEPPT